MEKWAGKKKTARELWVGEKRNKPSSLPLRFFRFFYLPLFMLRYNSKCQSEGPICILLLLAFAAIRLFKFMYIGRQKPGFGKAMEKSAGGGIFAIKSGNVGSGSTPPPPPPLFQTLKAQLIYQLKRDNFFIRNMFWIDGWKRMLIVSFCS